MTHRTVEQVQNSALSGQHCCGSPDGRHILSEWATHLRKQSYATQICAPGLPRCKTAVGALSCARYSGDNTWGTLVPSLEDGCSTAELHCSSRVWNLAEAGLELRGVPCDRRSIRSSRSSCSDGPIHRPADETINNPPPADHWHISSPCASHMPSLKQINAMGNMTELPMSRPSLFRLFNQATELSIFCRGRRGHLARLAARITVGDMPQWEGPSGCLTTVPLRAQSNTKPAQEKTAVANPMTHFPESHFWVSCSESSPSASSGCFHYCSCSSLCRCYVQGADWVPGLRGGSMSPESGAGAWEDPHQSVGLPVGKGAEAMKL
ncbi:hypothetical protein JZ751_028024 [Albula glossodonta]|uniref:Uncharacterized protein n=1 Tax=Albula glossodonta TaxID=121402 RepID=A0A8T2PCV9_9TELE|nr:hypothetical protein JZ751_028024 [Albula glossodonta]